MSVYKGRRVKGLPGNIKDCLVLRFSIFSHLRQKNTSLNRPRKKMMDRTKGGQACLGKLKGSEALNLIFPILPMA